MENKTTLGDLFEAQLGENFAVGDTLRDIVIEATSSAKWAEAKVDDDGGLAKVYASHYAEDMRKLARRAEEAVALLVANGKKEIA
jgi:hypothetical protein